MDSSIIYVYVPVSVDVSSVDDIVDRSNIRSNCYKEKQTGLEQLRINLDNGYTVVSCIVFTEDIQTTMMYVLYKKPRGIG